MDITQIYAISAAGLALSLLLRSGWWSLTSYFAPFCSRMFKYLTYSYVLRRHALIGPWTAMTVLAVLICVATNIVCLTLGTVDWSQAARRAETLSIINLGALYRGLHLNFLASLLGFSLGTVRVIHRSASLIALSLAGFHIVVWAVTDNSGFQRAALKPSALIAASTLCLLSIVPRCLVQRPSYEVFLRLHQMLALACGCAIWRHMRSDRDFPRVVLYIFSGLLGITFIGETGVVIFRNGCSYRWGSRVTITSTCGMVQLKVHLAKPLQLEPGQFLNLWMPSVSLGACLQSHPFLVTSWSAEPQRTLDIFTQVINKKGTYFSVKAPTSFDRNLPRIILEAYGHNGVAQKVRASL